MNLTRDRHLVLLRERLRDANKHQPNLVVEAFEMACQQIDELTERLTAIESKLAEREKAEQALDEQPCEHGNYENCRICNNDE